MTESVAGYDEWCDPAGQVRGHWAPLQGGLKRIGPVALARRWEEARRLIRDNGVTYSASDGSGNQRPWELDPIPALLPTQDRVWLQRGLAQRACLLQRILEDIYGPQELILGGKIPAEAVYASPGWHRPCVGLCFPPAARLLLYGADLTRDPQGQWLVLRDRTQCPTGFGYALENRLVVARMFPELFKECQTQALAPFFHGLRRTLSELTGEGESPLIVLLSGGPSTPGYFEDAYLAQYLGCLLVEGGDLTVRGNVVYLKMLDGLQSVEVVVRRIPDAACDPLELPSNSWAGVPGLLQAVRSGNVVVTNAVGAGWLETPALATLLPALCRELLGEELLLPSLPAGWCAEPEQRAWVLDNLPDLVIRSTFPTAAGTAGPWVVRDLSRERRDWLVGEIQRRPLDFVGQILSPPPTFPSLEEHQLAPRPGHYRFFVAQVGANPWLGGPAENRYGYQVMPGGMVRTRKAAAETGPARKLSWIGSKDLWWLRPDETAPVEEESLSVQPGPGRSLRIGGPLRLSRGGGDLPSRSADDFYWLGRYLERVEFLVRLARVCLTRGAERSDMSTLQEALLVHWPAFEPHLRSPVDLRRCLERWVGDSEKPDSLGSLLLRVQQLAGALRDRLSVDSLSILNALKPTHVTFREPNQVLTFLEHLTMPLWAWSGLASESLHRGHGFRFLELGRRLERALQTCRLLRPLLADGADSLLQEAVLDVGESSRAYRRRYQTVLHRAAIVDLLVADEGNPRSVGFQLKALSEHLVGLPHEVDAAQRSAAELILIKGTAAVKLFPFAGLDGRWKALEELLATLEGDLSSFSDALSQTYLTHLRPRQQREALVDHPWSDEV